MGFSTGNAMVDDMAELSLVGNITPHIWYKTLQNNGKPYLVAITILADIVYWYRPQEIRDERSGQLIGFKTKFRADLLQRSYKDYSEMFGLKTTTIKNAIRYLEERGIIQRIFRTISRESGVITNNIMFIALNVDALKAVTYPDLYEEIVEEYEEHEEESKEEAKEESKDENDSENMETDPSVKKLIDPPSKNYQRVRQKTDRGSVKKLIEGPSKNRQTLRQKTDRPSVKKLTEGPSKNYWYTKITDIDYIDNIYNSQSVNHNISRNTDGIVDHIDGYDRLIVNIKNQIGYENLINDMPDDIELIDEIANIILDVVFFEDSGIKVNGAEIPAAIVREKYNNLSEDHVRYVIDKIKTATKKISNPHGYIKTCLYNASSSIASYVATKQAYEHNQVKERAKNAFHNFEQREDDLDELEKMLDQQFAGDQET